MTKQTLRAVLACITIVVLTGTVIGLSAAAVTIYMRNSRGSVPDYPLETKAVDARILKHCRETGECTTIVGVFTAPGKRADPAAFTTARCERMDPVSGKYVEHWPVKVDADGNVVCH